MSNTSFSTQTSDAVATPGVGDAVWQYMTSLKAVKKRDGREEAFSREKLSRSVVAALEAAGAKEKDLGVAKQVVDQVVGRLTRVFDGHTTPSSIDVREMVNATFIDHNLVHASKKYSSYRFEARHE